jgi:hypothetical protein
MNDDSDELDEAVEAQAIKDAAALHERVAQVASSVLDVPTPPPGAAELRIAPDVLHLALRTLVLPPPRKNATAPTVFFQFDPTATNIVVPGKQRQFWVTLPAPPAVGAKAAPIAFEVDYEFACRVAAHMQNRTTELALQFTEADGILAFTVNSFSIRYTIKCVEPIELPGPHRQDEEDEGPLSSKKINSPHQLARALRSAGTFSKSRTKPPAAPKSLSQRLEAYRQQPQFRQHDAHVWVENGMAFGGAGGAACRTSHSEPDLSTTLAKADLALVGKALRRLSAEKAMWLDYADKQVFTDGLLSVAVARPRIEPQRVDKLWNSAPAFAGVMDRSQIHRTLTLLSIPAMQASAGKKPVTNLAFEDDALRFFLKTDASSGIGWVPMAQRDLESSDLVLQPPFMLWVNFPLIEKASIAVGGETVLVEVLTKTFEDTERPHILRITRTEGDFESKAVVLVEHRSQ